MAGTSACKTCVNNQFRNDYNYSNWFHVDIPSYSEEQLNNYTKQLLKDITKVKESTRDLNCNNCKHYHKQIVEGIEFVNQNYCKKGVNVASPSFWCKWGEVIE